MKTLYLIRHAKSSWDFPDLSDFDRPLNKRGKRNAPEMGRRLRIRGVVPDIVLSSPARRARETCLAVCCEIAFPETAIIFDSAIYAAGVNTLLQTVEGLPDDASSAFLVSHNPGITSFAEYLTGESLVNIPTCGIACIEMDFDSWSLAGREAGRLVFFDYPKKPFAG